MVFHPSGHRTLLDNFPCFDNQNTFHTGNAICRISQPYPIVNPHWESLKSAISAIYVNFSQIELYLPPDVGSGE